MNTPLLTWIFIIGIVALVIVVDAIGAFRHNAVHRHSARHHHRHHLIEIGSEREMLYMPGDPNPRRMNANGYDDDL